MLENTLTQELNNNRNRKGITQSWPCTIIQRHTAKRGKKAAAAVPRCLHRNPNAFIGRAHTCACTHTHVCAYEHTALLLSLALILPPACAHPRVYNTHTHTHTHVHYRVPLALLYAHSCTSPWFLEVRRAFNLRARNSLSPSLSLGLNGRQERSEREEDGKSITNPT